MAFQALVRNSATQARVVFQGAFNEEADFPRQDWKSFSSLSFDWGGVTYINSAGVGLWIKYINEVTATYPAQNIVFERCPFVVVEQMGKVKDFVKLGMKVSSFTVPFVCESCGGQKMVLFEDGIQYNNSQKKPPREVRVQCTKCHEAMDMDVIPAKYFRFLELCWG
jgi:hypothetical protein